ncbi:unnamed protein product [Laminaria digitata]
MLAAHSSLLTRSWGQRPTNEMVQGRLRAVLTTLIPILNRTRGSLAAFTSENIPRHHRSNPAAFFTAVRRFTLMESSSSSSSSSRQKQQQQQQQQQGSNSGKGKASASSSIPQRRSLKRSLCSGGDKALERGSAAGGRAFSTHKRPPTQLRANAAEADRGAGLTMDDAREALRSLFGHDDFRDGQEGVVSKLLAGESCAGVFPTGAGKSICYQLPGTLMARQGLGLTLVVSPLIALMKDQTDALKAAGVPCAKLDSTLEAHEVREIYQQIRAGSVSLLYVSPERFNNERFVSALRGIKVALFVVDEAHCISEWGHNFRPDYLRLADFARAAKASARLALTATATPKVTVDIASRLDIPPSNVMRTPFYRPMLNLGAVRAPDDPIERTNLLAQLMGAGGQEAAAGAAVVYVTLQKTAVEVAQSLVALGLDARPYHAGLPPLQREETQDWFMNAPDGASPVVVGTIAFGMGLDKKNVRHVYHFNLPRSPEDLAQQARKKNIVGRAGRDGRRAFCRTLVSAADLPLLRSMIYGGTPSPAAVRGLLRTVFAGGEAEADFSFYDLSQELDTKDLVLKTLLAHLQIRGLAKEVTPYFETADVGLLDAGRDVLDGGTTGDLGSIPNEWLQLLGMADAALKLKTSRAKWGTVRVDDAADVIDVPKTQIARMLSGMSDAGLIVLGKSGKIRARFRQVLRRPSSREEAQSLARELHQMALELEARELGRLETVMEILCDEEGSRVSTGLSRYFGDSDQTISETVVHENTAASASCAEGDALRHGGEQLLLSDLLTPAQVSEDEIDELWRVGVVDFLQEGGGEVGSEVDGQVIPCDDAYLLARFAAGIRSPRIAKLKLAKLSGFGSCSHCPFPSLLARAEAAVSAAVLI